MISVADSSQGAVVDCLTDAEQSEARLEHIKEGVCLCRSAELPALRISLTQTHQHTLVLPGTKHGILQIPLSVAVRQPSSQGKYFHVIFTCV